MKPDVRALLGEAMIKAAGQGSSPMLTVSEAAIEHLVALSALPDFEPAAHPEDDDATDPLGVAATAERLKSARQRRFSSAAAAADALGFNATTLRTHENGTRGFLIHDADRYARAYGVSLLWLLTGRNTEPQESVA